MTETATKGLRILQENELYMKIAMCIGLIILGAVFHFASKWWITKKFRRYGTGELLKSRKLTTLLTFLQSTVRYVVYFFILYMFCRILSLPIDSFFLAVAGAGSVAFGLGAQSLIKNIINGFFILLEDEYSVGDMVILGDYMGTVEEIGIRTTKVRSANGDLHIIPNGEISIATNKSKKVAIAVIDVNLPYKAEADHVIGIINDEIAQNGSKIDGLIGAPSVLGITSLGEYCYTIKVLSNCEQDKYLSVERELRYIIKKRFDLEKIPMPQYPFVNLSQQ